MTTPDEARRYLSEVLSASGTTLKAASLALGRNHAYLQQYIERGKPMWLSEPVRDGLATLFNIDPDRLRPPAATLRIGNLPADRYNKAEVNIPGRREIIDDPREMQLIAAWRTLTEDRRELCLRIIMSMDDRQSAISA